MKTHILAILIGFFTFSCSKNDLNQIKINPENEIAFQVELINSNENFISKAKKLTVKHKSAYWSLQLDEKINISRSTSFDLELENGKVVEFSVGFHRPRVSKELLILDDENLNPWGKNWDYKSFESETNDLYQKLETFQIIIDGRYIGMHSASANFSFVSSEKAQINGVDKSFVTIRFEGDAFGVYDPDGLYGVYKITNGIFKGVIE